MSNAGWTKLDRRGDAGVAPTLAPARTAAQPTTRLTLVSDAGEAAVRLGTVPLAFREWRGEVAQQAPPVRSSGWITAAAVHGAAVAAILLSVATMRLPEPLPLIAVTLTFEHAPTPLPAPAVAPIVEPIVDLPPVMPEPPKLETAPEPPAAAKPPVVPEPPLAAAPEPAKPAVVQPPAPPPRRVPRPAASPTQPPASQSAARQPPTPREAEPPPPTPPSPEQMAAVPVIPPLPVSAAAGNRKPDYPAAARRRRLEGRVLLRVEVSAAGAAAAVAVAASSGHPLLDEAALDAVKSWRFNPATRAGVAIAGVAEVPIQFRLED